MALLSCPSIARLQRSVVVSSPASRRAVVTVRAAAADKPAGKTPSAGKDKDALGKGDLVEKVADETGLPKAAVTKVFEALLGNIEGALASNKRVTIVGFGSFEARDRKERNGRNPQTGEPLKIAAAKAPAFKASKSLKDVLNGRAAPPKPKAAAPVKEVKAKAEKPVAASKPAPAAAAKPKAEKKAAPKNPKK